MARKPKLWMLVGVPCAGKSTWLNHQLDHEYVHEDLYIASTDDILEDIANQSGKTYNEVFKDNIKLAEKRMYANVAEAVKQNWDIAWDQTNLTRRSRAKKLIVIPDHYEKIAIVFPTPLDLDARLASRPGKTIPPHIVDAMVEMLERPEKDEGFTTIIDWTEDLYYV